MKAKDLKEFHEVNKILLTTIMSVKHVHNSLIHHLCKWQFITILTVTCDILPSAQLFKCKYLSCAKRVEVVLSAVRCI